MGGHSSEEESLSSGGLARAVESDGWAMFVVCGGWRRRTGGPSFAHQR